MNNPIFFSLLILSCLSICTSRPQQEKPQNDGRADSTLVSEDIADNPQYHSIVGVDSVAEADYVFADFLIDSISVTHHAFDAKYLTCFKGMINPQNYRFFKNRKPDEYQRIDDIHTAHVLNFGNTDFSFNGFGRMGCSAIPESTKVHVTAKVYSLYSGNKSLGKIIFLESISKLN